MVSNPYSDDFLGYLEGSIRSHEISSNSRDCYMLLSLRAQGALGFVKDIEAGTVFLKHQNAYVPLYAVHGSDLRAVCISDFEGNEPSKDRMHIVSVRRKRRTPIEEDSERKKVQRRS